MDQPLRPRLPWNRIIPGLCLDVFLGRRRDFLVDCRAMEAKLGEHGRVEGAENIPQTGALLIVANHLQGPGLWIGWPVALATAAIERARGDFSHWLVSIDYDRSKVGGAKRLIPLVEWSFARVAHAWSMIPVDPKHPGSAVRRILTHVREGEVCGLFPEGSVQGLTDGLQPPQDAAMRLMDRAAAAGAILVPVGLAVSSGVLTCRFLPAAASAKEAWEAVTTALGQEADAALV